MDLPIEDGGKLSHDVLGSQNVGVARGVGLGRGVDMIWSTALGDVFQTLRHGDGLWIAPMENASLCAVAHGMMAPATEL